jgi:hypothetical protein
MSRKKSLRRLVSQKKDADKAPVKAKAPARKAPAKKTTAKTTRKKAVKSE